MNREAHREQKLTIGVLYGFRALMVLFVCNYHFWQQSWLMQQFSLFRTSVYFDYFTRSSYLFVDGMLLLSGFLLYLPYAQAADAGLPMPSTKTFYWKRLIRIVPSYLASVFLMLFAVALPGGAYDNAGEAIADVLAHVTFTFPLFPDTYLYTPLNAVLWTIGVEVQFYLIFPLIARFMRKKPARTLIILAAAGILFRVTLALEAEDLAIWVNQMPSYLDVYALGMLGAILYLRLRRLTETGKAKTVVSIAAVILFCLGTALILSVLQIQSTASIQGLSALRLSQWLVRLPLALAMLVTMLSASFLPRLLQKPLDNRLMRFLSVISLNLYIWHQTLCILLVKPLFPQALHNDHNLQVIFTLLSLALAILTAMAFTYGLEHPAARWLQTLKDRKGVRPDARPAPPETV